MPIMFPDLSVVEAKLLGLIGEILHSLFRLLSPTSFVFKHVLSVSMSLCTRPLEGKITLLGKPPIKELCTLRARQVFLFGMKVDATLLSSISQVIEFNGGRRKILGKQKPYFFDSNARRDMRSIPADRVIHVSAGRVHSGRRVLVCHCPWRSESA